MTDWSKPLARHPGVIEEVVEDEVVLLMPHAGAVLVLNDVGRAIWGLIDGRRTIDALAEQICAEYEVEPAQARADIAAFVEQLAAKGLVTMSGS